MNSHIWLREPEDDGSTPPPVGQLRALIERTRLSLSNYYLMHMTRSVSADDGVVEMNMNAHVHTEQKQVDDVFPRPVVTQLIHEVAQGQLL